MKVFISVNNQIILYPHESEISKHNLVPESSERAVKLENNISQSTMQWPQHLKPSLCSRTHIFFTISNFENLQRFKNETFGIRRSALGDDAN
jgi:hypothetical protein